MALGGGTFQTKNKALPGAYINFISASRNLVGLSERGVVALPYELDWGLENQAVEIDADNFRMMAQPMFGRSPDAPELQLFREVFRHARKIIAYRLSNAAVKASNTFCEAKYGGARGNALKTVIQTNPDNSSAFNVSILLDFVPVFIQTNVANMTDLRENDYVTWKSSATLSATANTPLSGGSNGEDVTGAEHLAFRTAMEGRAYHVLACPYMDEAVANAYIEYTHRMRDDVGAKFQLVTVAPLLPDYEGVISLQNLAVGTEKMLCYWAAGAAAGCEINESLTNMEYDGEVKTPGVDRSQYELARDIEAGKLTFHRVGDSWNILEDINSLTSVTTEKGEAFKSSQTIRILDQIGIDVSRIFNQGYLGKVPNDNAGRDSLWGDIVQILRLLQTRRAIEAFDPENVSVEKGLTAKSVVVNCLIQPVNAMTQLYMTVVID